MLLFWLPSTQLCKFIPTDRACWMWTLNKVFTSKIHSINTNKINYEWDFFKLDQLGDNLYNDYFCHWPMRELYQLNSGLSLVNNQKKHYRRGTHKLVSLYIVIPHPIWFFWLEFFCIHIISYFIEYLMNIRLNK